MELPFAGLHQLCSPMLDRLGLLTGPQRRGLGVAFGLVPGENPDRFLVALAALSLLAETSEEQPLLCAGAARGSGTRPGHQGRRPGRGGRPAEHRCLRTLQASPGAFRRVPRRRAAALPCVQLLLAAWRGEAAAAAELTAEITRGASARGEGVALTYAEYAAAVLGNGLGHYEAAAGAAHSASAAGELVISPWALNELVEAAVRSDQPDRAAAAADQLSSIAVAAGSDWARGAAARSRALVASGRAADELYREAVELLSRTRLAAHLARARLSYGEWLRREHRRVEARRQLRPAFEAFESMGARAFADRARRELLATGERMRKRSESSRACLTPQEEEIAQLAREGRTNPEIGAQLFIGSRTVEWHLHKVFAKLGINSRRELDQALKRRHQRADAPGEGGAASR